MSVYHNSFYRTAKAHASTNTSFSCHYRGIYSRP